MEQLSENEYITLNVKKLREREKAHKYLAKKLDFPEYYGANLDALHDCLSEKNNLKICFKNTEYANEYFECILSVFEDCDNITIFKE